MLLHLFPALIALTAVQTPGEPAPIAAAPFPAAAAAIDDEVGPEPGSLAAYLPDPDLYLEYPDLQLFGEHLTQSGLGPVLQYAKPLLEASLEQGKVQLGLGLSAIEVDGDQLADAWPQTWDETMRATMAWLSPMLELDGPTIDAISGAFGSRLSYAFVSAEPWEKGGQDEIAWALSWSLQTGGDEALLEHVFPLVRSMLSDAFELFELPVVDDGSYPTLQFRGPEIGKTFFVVRPDLVAWTGDWRMAERLRRAPAPSHAEGLSRFQLARRDAVARGESLWITMRSQTLMRREAYQDREARLYMLGLGLNQLGDLSLGITGHEGRLASRMRVEKSGNAGLLSLLRGGEPSWSCLQALTADTFAVAAFGRSARDGLDELIDTMLWIHPETYRWLREHWKRMRDVPLVGEALEPGALGPELAVFARPGLGPVPFTYACVPLGERLHDRLVELEQQHAAGGEPLRLQRGGMFVELRFHRPDGGESGTISEGIPYWVARLDPAGYLAWARQGDHLVLSESAPAIKAYLSARLSERLADRERAIAVLLEEVDGMSRDVQREGGRPAAFLHVRVEEILLRLWPMARLALTMQGLPGIDRLGDVGALSGKLGNTTLLLSESEEAIEIRGRGLLGGLLGIF